MSAPPPPPAAGGPPPRRLFSTPARLAGVAVLLLTLAAVGWTLTSERLEDFSRPLAACGALFAGVVILSLGASCLRARK